MNIRRYAPLLLVLCCCPVLQAERPKGKGGGVWLGVTLARTGDGLKVTSVLEGSPAHEGGLKAGDVIVEMDGRKTTDINALRAVLSGKKDGEAATVLVRRAGCEEPIKLTLTLRERKKRDALSIAKRIAPAAKERTSEHYRLLTDMEEDFVKKALEKLERMFERYCEFFDTEPKPKSKLNVIVFKNHDSFEKFAGRTRGVSAARTMGKAFGYFEFAVEGRPVVSRWLGSADYSHTLCNIGHEAAHQFTWTFVLNKISVVQAWFDEGIAVNFEVEDPFPHNTRFWYLQHSLSRGEWLPLKDLIEQWRKHFNSRKRMLCYNEAGGFVHFLARTDSPYRKAFLRYLNRINLRKAGPWKAADLAGSLGKKIEEVEKEFKAWVRKTPYKGPHGSRKK